MAARMREREIQRVNAGAIVLPFAPIPGFVEDQLSSVEYKLCEIKSVPDAYADTGRRKLYRYKLREGAKVALPCKKENVNVKSPRKELRRLAALAEQKARKKRRLLR
jgi:hypothetical protein